MGLLGDVSRKKAWAKNINTVISEKFNRELVPLKIFGMLFQYVI